jgi:hypothetical protein
MNIAGSESQLPQAGRSKPPQAFGHTISQCIELSTRSAKTPFCLGKATCHRDALALFRHWAPGTFGIPWMLGLCEHAPTTDKPEMLSRISQTGNHQGVWYEDNSFHNGSYRALGLRCFRSPFESHSSRNSGSLQHRAGSPRVQSIRTLLAHPRSSCRVCPRLPQLQLLWWARLLRSRVWLLWRRPEHWVQFWDRPLVTTPRSLRQPDELAALWSGLLLGSSDWAVL